MNTKKIIGILLLGVVFGFTLESFAKVTLNYRYINDTIKHPQTLSQAGEEELINNLNKLNQNSGALSCTTEDADMSINGYGSYEGSASCGSGYIATGGGYNSGHNNELF